MSVDGSDLGLEALELNVQDQDIRLPVEVFYVILVVVYLSYYRTGYFGKKEDELLLDDSLMDGLELHDSKLSFLHEEQLVHQWN
jgi:hypothetical protein